MAKSLFYKPLAILIIEESYLQRFFHTLENLRDYTVKHFTDEEQYMESINYKKLFTQKVQHLKFIHKLDEFIEHHNDEIEDQDEQIMVICVESADRG